MASPLEGLIRNAIAAGFKGKLLTGTLTRSSGTITRSTGEDFELKVRAKYRKIGVVDERGKLKVGVDERGKLKVGVDEYGDLITSNTTYRVEGFADNFNETYRAAAGIPENDFKITLILGNSETEPLKDDTISLPGWGNAKVRAVKTDPAKASAECQVFAV